MNIALWRRLCVLLVVLLAIAGCGKEDLGEEEQELVPEQSVIRIMGVANSEFMTKYGNAYVERHPHVELEYIAGPIQDQERLFALMRERQPDIVLSNNFVFKDWIEAGQLADLDGYARSDFNLAELARPVVEWLEWQGEGRLYGLTPTFDRLGLYFNKALFDQKAVPYPADFTTWENVFEAASHFRRTGVQPDEPYGLFLQGGAAANQILQVGNSSGLQLVGDGAASLHRKDGPWNRIIRQMIQAHQLGSINPGAPGRDHLFLNGQAAMTLDSALFVTRLNSPESRLGPDSWGLVTEPVSALSSNLTGTIHFGDIFAIYADSANKPGAWSLIRFVHGEEMAGLLREAEPHSLLSRLSHLSEHEELEVFLKLGASRSNIFQSSDLSLRYVQRLGPVLEQEIAQVISGSKGLEEALDDLHQAVEQILSEVLHP